jgi:SsrA-binding protein
MATSDSEPVLRAIASNRKARHEYEILDELECGITLTGTEVKSLRQGQCSLAEAYAYFRRGELWLMNATIPEYRQGNIHNHPPTRERKLLAHKRELAAWDKRVKERGVTIVPLDALIENFRMGTMEGLGIGYEMLRQDNPGLIYCEISGFGRTGPYAERAGFDLIAQGMSGLMAITGEGPGRPPVKVGAPVSDIVAGILAAMGVCAAYAHKQKTGEGQKVDTSLFEAGIALTYWQSAIAFATGQSPGPLGSAHPLNAPYQAFRTADGWINVGAANQRNWERMLSILGRPELQDDPRFATNEKRMHNLPSLVEALTAVFEEQPAAHWLAALDSAGVPAGPVLSIAEMLQDPQAAAREMVPEVAHPVAGRVRTIGAPVKFSQTPCAVTEPAPTLGQHTRDVLGEFGYDGAEIERLIRDKVVIG